MNKFVLKKMLIYMRMRGFIGTQNRSTLPQYFGVKLNMKSLSYLGECHQASIEISPHIFDTMSSCILYFKIFLQNLKILIRTGNIKRRLEILAILIFINSFIAPGKIIWKCFFFNIMIKYYWNNFFTIYKICFV